MCARAHIYVYVYVYVYAHMYTCECIVDIQYVRVPQCGIWTDGERLRQASVPQISISVGIHQHL